MTVWSGQWTADRLGARLRTTAGVGGLVAEDLVGMALRRNPRRAHLLVSRVLGKHVPTDPRLVHGAGRLLGALVADRLTGVPTGLAEDGGALVAAALRGDGTASSRLLAALDVHLPGAEDDALVLGYAETATGLGHSVADQLRAPYLHSTRRPVPGVTPVGAFEESHSHATSHLLLPEDAALLAGPRPLVLVDDELSTGATVMDTVRALQAVAPRQRYLVAALVDLRTAADRAALAAFADRTGVQVEVVALVTGEVALPADALARGGALVAQHGRPPVTAATRPVEGRAATGWPDGVRDGGRHGFTDAERPAFDAAVAAVARQLRPGLPRTAGERLLVLGTEELMYLPTRLAAELATLLADDGVEVLFSSTTRSPVVPVDEPGCAIRTALTFPAHDAPADGPGPRFAYNVAPPAGGTPFDAALLVVDDASTGRDAALRARLAAVVAGPVTVFTVPSARPGTR
ncbi:phosphoribosyltransferase domain-containing protein [Modestobacter sp. VKM Ac-2986]|uniref:phosphoribosyltransferase domain-containing protein n=1 Tax=Modestobacter sp. VKM Ac-2986 TaxID=3004140 RepID=UPI0022AB5FE0|nr:phosphoribosyltransferase domain-containing protein [Modestobacter sp. VKM Ac-2986]MCZ2830743.1 phosphoribosyltransferase domain-containing protein [Modestobacter sp. VKM Ac-2986]